MTKHIKDVLDNSLDLKNSFERKPLLHPKIDPIDLYKKFKTIFFEIEGKEFVVTDESISLVYTLIYFFQKKDNFYKSQLIYNYPSTKIDLNKGLIIVGGFGCGKTSILKVFQSIINHEEKVHLKFTSTIQAVSLF